MSKEKLIISEDFFGFELSELEKKAGKVSYSTLVKPFNIVLNNNIIDNVVDGWEPFNGPDESEEDTIIDVYQYYIIDKQFATFLKRFTNEFILFNSDINMFLWGVTHYGTSWDNVLTEILIREEEK